MKTVDLVYNPYTKKTDLTIDEEKVEASNYCCSAEKELSVWVYDFLKKLILAVNDDLEIFFSGIPRDYDFLVDAKQKFESEKKDVEILLKQKNVCPPSAKFSELKELFSKMQKETPFDELKPTSEGGKQIETLFNKAVDSTFEIAVVATMSSGKSTLINALLGQDLLPARNEATTATLASIYDIDGMDHFEGESFDENDVLITKCNPLTLENMEELNDEKTYKIEIKGDIPNISSQDIRLVLTDTPGPNNSKTAEHKRHTYKLFKADYKPMILYILNATQLEATDDETLLNEAAEQISKGDKQSSDRFLFVLNKADNIDAEKDGTIGDIIKKAKDYLERHGIKNPRIFPCASLLAKVIRKTQNNFQLTEFEEDDVLSKADKFIKRENRHFSDHAVFLSPQTKQDLKEKIKRAQEKENKYEEALFYTGIPSIEMAISEYLEKYALPAKVTKAVNSFLNKINALDVETGETTKLQNNKDAADEAQKEIKKIQQTLENGEKGRAVKEKIKEISIEAELKTRFKDASTNFFDTIIDEIDEAKSDFSPKEARRFLRNLNKTIEDEQTSFEVEVGELLDKGMKTKIQSCVDEYTKYLKDLVGESNYSISSPQTLFGSLSTLDVSEVIEDYTETKEERYVSGTHTEKNSDYHFGDGFFNIFRREKKQKYIEVKDYATKEVDFVDMENLLEKEVVPNIRKYLDNTKDAVGKFAKGEEEKFKTFFENKLSELEEKIKEKLSEKQKMLSNKEKFEAEVKKAEKNLKWIKTFKEDLQKVLAI